MKSLLTIIIAGILCMSTANAAATEPLKAVPVASTASSPASKRVCIVVLDNKTNKKITKCKRMKVNKKHNGTVVPERKK